MGQLEQTKSKIIQLLTSHANHLNESPEMAILIADKCFEMGHLYRDMGFTSRIEMNGFMRKYFPKLAAAKPVEIRWKKFLFDTIGEIAPACWQCKDSGNCFKCDILEHSA
jgi:nitrogen fixation protein NifQ